MKKKRTIIAVETPYSNEVKEGELYIDINENTGKIKTLAKRQGDQFIDQIERNDAELNIQSISEETAKIGKDFQKTVISDLSDVVASKTIDELIVQSPKTVFPYLAEDGPCQNLFINKLTIKPLGTVTPITVTKGYWSNPLRVTVKNLFVESDSTLDTPTNRVLSNINLKDGVGVISKNGILDEWDSQEYIEMGMTDSILYLCSDNSRLPFKIPDIKFKGKNLVKFIGIFQDCFDPIGNDSNSTGLIQSQDSQLTLDFTDTSTDLGQYGLHRSPITVNSICANSDGKFLGSIRVLDKFDYSFIFLNEAIYLSRIETPVIARFSESKVGVASNLIELHFKSFPMAYTEGEGTNGALPGTSWSSDEQNNSYDFTGFDKWVIGVKESLLDNSVPVTNKVHVKLNDVTLAQLTQEDINAIEAKGIIINSTEAETNLMIGDFD